MIRVAMWSGPRNISTAMMRAWENRADTLVCDEPLYAHYLQHSGQPHPGAAEVIAAHETDWRRVVAWLTGPLPEGKHIFYQKQMAHHLLPHIELDWLGELSNCFLIRDPGEMLTSLIDFLPQPTAADTGLPQQVQLYERLQSTTPGPLPVLDAKDVLQDPRGLLTRLCELLGVEFDAAMLDWPAGIRPTDGVWAKHWYQKVALTTCFSPYRPKPDGVPAGLRPVWEECRPLYEKLHRHRIRPED